MKVFKRNAVILTVLAFVCVAIYLNWSYGRKEDAKKDVLGPANTASAAAAEDSSKAAGLYYGDTGSKVSDYFAAARLSREQARDSAVTALNGAVSAMSTASQDTVNDTLKKLAVINETALTENEMENMIKAKGFSDCVVFLEDGAATVTVSAPQTGLKSSEVAQIADVVTKNSDITLEQLNIVEVK